MKQRVVGVHGSVRHRVAALRALRASFVHELTLNAMLYSSHVVATDVFAANVAEVGRPDAQAFTHLVVMSVHVKMVRR